MVPVTFPKLVEVDDVGVAVFGPATGSTQRLWTLSSSTEPTPIGIVTRRDFFAFAFALGRWGADPFTVFFANEIVLGESVLSGEIDPGLVFMVNAALLCCHSARSIGACNADTNVAPFGVTDISLKEKTQFNDAHIIGAMGTRASQFMRESYIRTPSYDERGFNSEMEGKISSGKLSTTMFSQLDEIFAEVGIFPLQKSRNLAVEIINAAMALSILCRTGLNRCLPLLYFDLDCAGLLKRHQVTCCADLEKFIFDQFWSGAYFSVVRGIRNLDYASAEGSMIVGSLYSNLLKYEGRA